MLQLEEAKVKFSALVLASATGLLMASAAMAVDVKIGVLNDRSGVYADLSGEGLVIHAGNGRSAMHTLVHDLFADAGLEPHVAHQVAETSTLVTFVAAGLGVAVVPEPTSDLGVPGVVYVPLVGTPGVDLVVATREGDTNPVLARALARLGELAA